MARLVTLETVQRVPLEKGPCCWEVMAEVSFYQGGNVMAAITEHRECIPGLGLGEQLAEV